MQLDASALLWYHALLGDAAREALAAAGAIAICTVILGNAASTPVDQTSVLGMSHPFEHLSAVVWKYTAKNRATCLLGRNDLPAQSLSSHAVAQSASLYQLCSMYLPVVKLLVWIELSGERPVKTSGERALNKVQPTEQSCFPAAHSIDYPDCICPPRQNSKTTCHELMALFICQGSYNCFQCI